MTGLFNVLSLGLMGVSMLPMMADMFPKTTPSTVFIRAGQHNMATPHEGTGGTQPGVALFNSIGERIGFKESSASTIIKDGMTYSIKVDPMEKDNTQDAEYMSLIGGADPLCIAYFTMTSHSGEAKYGIYGDVPKACGAPWYHQSWGVSVGNENKKTYRPSCFWIAGPGKGSDGQPKDDYPMGYGFHLSDFLSSSARNKQFNTKATKWTMCDVKPRFHMYHQLSPMTCLPVFDPILEFKDNGADNLAKLKKQGKGKAQCSPGGNDVDPYPSGEQKNKLEKYTHFRTGNQPTYGTKRSTTEQEESMPSNGTMTMANGKSRITEPNYKCTHPTELIESDFSEHTATELCQSPHSSGPDFLSHHESLFCDMCTSELWRVCEDADDTHGCFDKDAKEFRGAHANGTIHARDSAGRAIPRKSYTTHSHWRAE